MQDLQPGQIILPHAADESPQPPPGAPPAPGHPPLEQPEDPEPIPAPTPAPETALPVAAAAPETAVSAAANIPDPAAAPDPSQQPDWYTRQPADAPGSQPPLPDTIGWTASEFLAHEKGVQWYVVVAVGGVIAAIADYLLTRDIFSTGVILFAAAAFGAISARKPRTQEYSLTHQALQIGGKVYYFHDFKNFSVTAEGAIISIVFMPLKRFMPALTIYVAPDMEDQVVDFLSELLPFEQHKGDAVDSLLRRIRF